MEPNYYNNQPQPTKKSGGTFQKLLKTNQISILSKSLLIAGAGFLAIALLGGLFSYGIVQGHWFQGAAISTLYIISIVLIIVSGVMSFFIWRKIETVKKSTIAIMYTLYCLAEGFAFGILFSAFTLNFGSAKGIQYLILIFAIGGFAFLIAGLIGHRLSAKQTMSLGKFIMYMSIAFMIMFGVTLILMIVSICTGGFSGAMDSWVTAIMCFSCVLFFLYIMYDISIISKSQAYVGIQENAIQMNYALMFGFVLLVDFVGLVWQIAYMFLRYAR